MGLFNEYSNEIERIADSYHLSREDSRVVLSCIEFARMKVSGNTNAAIATTSVVDYLLTLEAIEQKIKDYLKNED